MAHNFIFNELSFIERQVEERIRYIQKGVSFNGHNSVGFFSVHGTSKAISHSHTHRHHAFFQSIEDKSLVWFYVRISPLSTAQKMRTIYSLYLINAFSRNLFLTSHCTLMIYVTSDMLSDKACCHLWLEMTWRHWPDRHLEGRLASR